MNAEAGSAVQARRELRAHVPIRREGLRTTRVFDLVVGGVLLFAFLPLMMLIVLFVAAESGGPVLYRSRRVGFGGDEFEMLKFRKMRKGVVGPPLTIADDPRFTRVGRLLARTKLDELPQLWNVLRGDMSLVGPRPEDPIFVRAYPREFREVLTRPPGITGLAQLAFARESQILARPEFAGRYVDRILPAKLDIDLVYVQRRSLSGDLAILAWTLGAIAFRFDVAVNRQSGRLSVRRRTQLPAPATAQVEG